MVTMAQAGNILVSSAGEVRLADFGLTAELIEVGYEPAYWAGQYDSFAYSLYYECI